MISLFQAKFTGCLPKLSSFTNRLSFRMKLLLLLLPLLVATVQANLLSRLFHRDSQVTTSTTTEKPQQPLFIHNTLPPVEPGCTAHYSCSKKLKSVAAPRPCVKYCLKRIECPGNVIVRGLASQCVELDEALVLQEIEAKANQSPSEQGATTEKIMEVAMIDFPCQPGYLPDSRGRCREIW